MELQIPPSLKAEHEELHGDLARATKAGGRTGEAAKAVAKLMHPHFIKEEEVCLAAAWPARCAIEGPDRVQHGRGNQDDRQARSRTAAYGARGLRGFSPCLASRRHHGDRDRHRAIVLD